MPIFDNPPLCVSILPVDMPVKDPIVSSLLLCEAVRTWLMSTLSKAGPVGVDAIAEAGRGRRSLSFEYNTRRYERYNGENFFAFFL